MVDIKKLQTGLNTINFIPDLETDGILGNLTSKAIQDFTLWFNEPKCDMFAINRVLKRKNTNVIDVPYVTQRTSYKEFYRMCNLACVNMLLKYYGVNSYSIEALDHYVDTDQAIKMYATANLLTAGINSGKLEQYSSIIVLVLNTLLNKNITEEKNKMKFKLDYLTQEQLFKKISDKKPIILGTKLSGFEKKDKTKGHYVVLVGQFEDYSIIHDPYGFYGKYNSLNADKKGAYVIIKNSDLFGDYGCKTAFDEVDNTDSENKEKYRAIFLK
jgi:hypothetical protein